MREEERTVTSYDFFFLFPLDVVGFLIWIFYSNTAYSAFVVSPSVRLSQKRKKKKKEKREREREASGRAIDFLFEKMLFGAAAGLLARGNVLAKGSRLLSTRPSLVTVVVARAMSSSSSSSSSSFNFSNPELSPQALADFYHSQFEESVGHDGQFPVLDPARREELTRLNKFGAAATRVAVERAHVAFTKEWNQARVTAQRRYDTLVRWEKLIRENVGDLAALVTLENGKPVRESHVEVTGGADSVAWFAEEARRINGDVLPGAKKRQRVMVIKQPVGVVGAITPWNFPFSMITRKIGPALAAGCTVVLKPSEDTPLSAIALAFLAQKAGFPKGCIQLVCGDAPAIGKELMSCKDVRKIGFTGNECRKRRLKED